MHGGEAEIGVVGTVAHFLDEPLENTGDRRQDGGQRRDRRGRMRRRRRRLRLPLFLCRRGIAQERVDGVGGGPRRAEGVGGAEEDGGEGEYPQETGGQTHFLQRDGEAKRRRLRRVGREKEDGRKI